MAEQEPRWQVSYHWPLDCLPEQGSETISVVGPGMNTLQAVRPRANTGNRSHQKACIFFQFYVKIWPWPGCSVGWSIVPYTKRLWVQSPVRVLTGGNQSKFLSHINVFPSPSPSLSLCLPSSLAKINKHILKWVKNKIKMWKSFFVGCTNRWQGRLSQWVIVLSPVLEEGDKPQKW